MALSFEWDAAKATANEQKHGIAFDEPEDMQSEYDFSAGVRGKHHLAYQTGYTLRVYKADGSLVEEEHIPLSRTVLLDPDVFAYFPDSESVNRALRALIEIVPQKRSA